MTLGKCKDCAWWNRTAGTDTGVCQRFPPDVYRRGEDDKFWVQPETMKDTKCAEFVAEVE